MFHHPLYFRHRWLLLSFRRHLGEIELVENFLKRFCLFALGEITSKLVKAPITLLFFRTVTLGAIGLEKRPEQVGLIGRLHADRHQAQDIDEP